MNLVFPVPQQAAEPEPEQGQIQIVHLEEDVLRRSGAALQTVEHASPQQRQSGSPAAAAAAGAQVRRLVSAAPSHTHTHTSPVAPERFVTRNVFVLTVSSSP